MRHRSLSLAGTVLAGLPASAMAGTVNIDIPHLTVAEYHRPYVAIWLEPTGGGEPRTVAVWYDAKHRGEPGTKWLSDLRSWWRVAGRNAATPPAAISGATRAPGHYAIPLPGDLKPGAYTLKVEAARETGGRELVSVPVTLPRQGGKAEGHGELGAVSVTLP
jgi:hypothetical protein